MKKVMVAPYGKYIDNLFISLKEVAPEKVVLVVEQKDKDKTAKIKEKIESQGIDVGFVYIKGNVYEEFFGAVSKIKEGEKDKELILNVSTGDRDTQCAATSAAFVNGIKAISVSENKSMLLPVMKFSYYKILTDKKLDIVKFLYHNDCCSSLDELSKKTGMSLPLVSYHINGTLKSEGLKELGLIETEEIDGKIKVTLTTLGRLLVKGYVV